MNDKIYRACAYLRLSREDEDKRGGMDESNSIKSQRMMIESFVRGLSDVELVKEVCDDGYTGTDYERPAFKEMIAMVERGEIDCIGKGLKIAGGLAAVIVVIDLLTMLVYFLLYGAPK